MKKFVLFINIIFALNGCAGCSLIPNEGCDKSYTLIGNIKNSNNDPLIGVLVRWDTSNATLFTETDEFGGYTYNFSTLGPLEGMKLKYSKSDYITHITSAYTEDEAGKDVCGDIKIIRDAILELE